MAGRPWVAVYAPHPDDETYGPGGTIARLHALGYRIVQVVLTAGDASLYYFPWAAIRREQRLPATRRAFAAARLQEWVLATRRLAGDDQEWRVYGLPDGRLSPGDVSSIVEAVDREFHPVAHLGTEGLLDGRHPDHLAAYLGLLLARLSAARKWFYHVYAERPRTPGLIEVRLDRGPLALKRLALSEYAFEDHDRQRYGLGYHSTPYLWERYRRQRAEYLRPLAAGGGLGKSLTEPGRLCYTVNAGGPERPSRLRV